MKNLLLKAWKIEYFTIKSYNHETKELKMY